MTDRAPDMHHPSSHNPVPIIPACKSNGLTTDVRYPQISVAYRITLIMFFFCCSDVAVDMRCRGKARNAERHDDFENKRNEILPECPCLLKLNGDSFIMRWNTKV